MTVARADSVISLCHTTDPVVDQPQRETRLGQAERFANNDISFDKGPAISDAGLS